MGPHKCGLYLEAVVRISSHKTPSSVLAGSLQQKRRHFVFGGPGLEGDGKSALTQLFHWRRDLELVQLNVG